MQQAEISDPGPTETPRAAEAALVSRLQAGDDSAYAEVVNTYGGRLLAVARRIMRSEADAEDVLQEAFLSAFKAIERFDGRSTLGTWLHRITVNAALMRKRWHKARPATSIESLLPQYKSDGHHADPPQRWTSVTNDVASRIEESELLWSAIDRLPPEYREVVVLREIEGIDSKSVAAELGISDALVRQRLHRARQALMKLLEPAILGTRAPAGVKS